MNYVALKPEDYAKRNDCDTHDISIFRREKPATTPDSIYSKTQSGNNQSTFGRFFLRN